MSIIATLRQLPTSAGSVILSSVSGDLLLVAGVDGLKRRKGEDDVGYMVWLLRMSQALWGLHHADD